MACKGCMARRAWLKKTFAAVLGLVGLGTITNKVSAKTLTTPGMYIQGTPSYWGVGACANNSNCVIVWLYSDQMFSDPDFILEEEYYVYCQGGSTKYFINCVEAYWNSWEDLGSGEYRYRIMVCLCFDSWPPCFGTTQNPVDPIYSGLRPGIWPIPLT